MAVLPKNRYALLIATSAYKDAGLRQLTAPGADVKTLAEVLAVPTLGGYKVKTVINKSWWAVQQAIARFFSDRDPTDVLLLYFSCHGLKSDDGHLYFAMADTNRNILRASSVPDDLVQEQMRVSRARQQVLILDCCYGGFFTNRMLTKSDTRVDDIDRFQGQGAVILTGSNSIQYAFEGRRLKNNSRLSVFTSAIVKGLKTGTADLDGDGLISAVDLVGYARREMRDHSRTQSPTLSTVGLEGEIYIAAVPASKRKKQRIGAPVQASPDGWVELTHLVDRSPTAKTREAVIVAMETSLAFRGNRISLSEEDLHTKLSNLSRSKEGSVTADWIYVIDHLGVRAEHSKKVYTARSFPLKSLDEIAGQIRLGRPVLAGVTWYWRWLEDPIVKTGRLDFKRTDVIGHGSMVTIVGYNEEDGSFRFVWQLAWGDRGLGWMSKAVAKACIPDNPFAIEAAEMTMPFSR